MGARGPKPGFKRARAEEGAEVQEASAPSLPEQDLSALSAQDRENPDKLSGQALKALAHRRGLAKSTLDTMSDEKIRTQLRYITHRQYDNEMV